MMLIPPARRSHHRFLRSALQTPWPAVLLSLPPSMFQICKRSLLSSIFRSQRVCSTSALPRVCARRSARRADTHTRAIDERRAQNPQTRFLLLLLFCHYFAGDSHFLLFSLFIMARHIRSGSTIIAIRTPDDSAESGGAAVRPARPKTREKKKRQKWRAMSRTALGNAFRESGEQKAAAAAARTSSELSRKNRQKFNPLDAEPFTIERIEAIEARGGRAAR